MVAFVSSGGPGHPSTLPIPLGSVHVDVTTRLGATRPVTPTGIRALDTALAGGLRGGSVLGFVGDPGSGRTTLALSVAYMAARTQAGVVFVARGLDDTEIMARLSARALRRNYPSSEVSYGEIWSGQAFQSDDVRRAVGEALDTVVSKVGAHFHLLRMQHGEPLAELPSRMGQLWARYERVVVVIDDLENFAHAAGDLDGRVAQAALDACVIAEKGAAVVFSALRRHAEPVAPATSALVAVEPDAAGARACRLRLMKNRIGPTGVHSIALSFAACEVVEPAST
jgi:hypothetical protein